MIILNCPQRSEEWKRARLGIPTASEVRKIITAKTAQLSKQSEDFMCHLLAEWMLGAPLEDYASNPMFHGIETEEQARSSYEFETGSEVRQVGFVLRDDQMFGASPDGLVGDNIVLELKCPTAPVHIGYMLTKSVADEYKPQAQALLYVCEREEIHVQSYFAGLPTVIMKAGRDEDYISKLKDAVDSFVEVMLRAREEIAQRFGIQPRKVVKKEDGLDALGITADDLEAIMRDERARVAKRLETT